MADRVCDIDEVKRWMTDQPLCKWAAEKQRQIDAGIIQPMHQTKIIHPDSEKSEEDKALAAALAAFN